MKKVKFTLLGNVMTGGVRTDNNFLVSENYISGSVLRAAFASSILLECPFAEEIVDGKKFFVSYRGEKCGNCANTGKCRKFSDMKFSFLYPENAVPAPFTLRECKGHGTAHPIKDTIAENGKLACSVCKGRMETVKGFINPDTNKAVKVSRSNSTHTAIDEYTHTALDGSLFSINSISKGQVFEGYIDDCDTDMVTVGTVVYCGKYSSNGYGKMKITEVNDVEKTACEEAVDSFNVKFGVAVSKRLGQENKLYASLLVVSDAKLGLENFDDSKPRTSEEYRNEWQERIFGKESLIKLEQIYAQNYIYSGFDTSRTDNAYDEQKSACILTERGTSVLVSFDKADKSKAIDFLDSLAQTGIGAETEIGYGKVEICNKLHLIGVGKND